MTEILQKITTFISDLNEKEIKQYAGALFGLIVLVLSVGIYKYFSETSELKKSIRSVNETRQDVKYLLSKNDQIKKQKAKVENLINQEKKFYIKQYFNEALEKFGLVTTKEADLAETALKEGYKEITLTANISRADTQQLVGLLGELEQKERIYIKKLDITKKRNNNKFNFIIVIATLQPKPKTSETTR